MNKLVKILYDDDGEKIENPVWHLVDPANLLGPSALCSGEYFGYGESSVVYEEKEVVRGGIECRACIDKIKLIKSVRL